MATTNLRQFFGSELAFYRRRTEMTQADLAREVGYSINTIQSVEQGVRSPSDDLCRRLDAVLGLDGVLARLGAKARADVSPFGDFRAYEQQATAIYVYEGFVVPGLLQTLEYAAAVIAAASPEADAQAAAADRVARQERVMGDNAPPLHVIIDQSVLEREIGGPAVFREQLARLLDPGPTVTVRVLPHSTGAHPGLRGSVTVLHLPENDRIAFADGHEHTDLMDAPDAVARCASRWDWLSARALPVEVSADWIRTVMEDL